MTQKCSICNHRELKTINQALINGGTLRGIAKQFNVSDAAVFRHKENHLPADLKKAKEAAEVAQADSLLAQVQELQQKAYCLLEQAEGAGDLKSALQGVKEARGCIELLAKLQGELAQEGQVNIIMAQEWLELRAVIIQAIEPFPEAKEAVSEALRRVEE